MVFKHKRIEDYDQLECHNRLDDILTGMIPLSYASFALISLLTLWGIIWENSLLGSISIVIAMVNVLLFSIIDKRVKQIKRRLEELAEEMDNGMV